MVRQKATQTAREMAKDGGAPGSVKRAIAPVTNGLGTSTRPNRAYRHATILALVALAASNGTSAGGCLGPRECASVVGRVPTAEWARVALRTCDADGAPRHLRTPRIGAARSPRRSSWRLTCTAYAGTGARCPGGWCTRGPTTGRLGGKCT